MEVLCVCFSDCSFRYLYRICFSTIKETYRQSLESSPHHTSSTPGKNLAKYADDQRDKDFEGKAGTELEGQPRESDQKTSKFFQKAASSNRTNVIHELSQGKRKGTKSSLSSSASGQTLFVDIQKGHQKAAVFLLEAGEGLDSVDEQGETLRHCAAKAG